MGPHAAKEVVLSHHSLDWSTPKMGIKRSGYGYFKISHVVLHLEESDSGSPVFCFGFRWHGSEVHGSLKMKLNKSNTGDRAGSAFTLFRR